MLGRSGWSFCILLSELLSEFLERSPFLELFCLNSSEGHLFLKFTSWRSPFSEISSTFLPLEVTFLEISGHGLHFSQIYLANYVGHMKIVFLLVVFLQVVCLLLSFCRMSVCVLLILGTLTGPQGIPGASGGNPQNRSFFRIDFLMVFSWFWHRFWMTFLMIFACFLDSFFDTFFKSIFSQCSCFFSGHPRSLHPGHPVARRHLVLDHGRGLPLLAAWTRSGQRGQL